MWKRPKEELPENPQKILLLMCNWLGDTFWALQIFPYIRNKYPSAEIYIGIKSFSAPLVNSLANTKNIIFLDGIISDRTRETISLKHFLKNLKNVRRKKFDIVVDLTCNYFSALFTRFSSAKYSYGGNLDDLSYLYSNFISEESFKGKHLSERAFIILGLSVPKYLIPPLHFKTKFQLYTENHIPLDKSVAVFHVRTGWHNKDIPVKYIDKIVKHLQTLDTYIILIGSSKDRLILNNFSKKIHGVNIFIKSLEDAIDLVQYVDLYIGGDTGLTHIAAAGNTNVLALFCPSNPEYSYPKGKNVTLFQPECPIALKTTTEQCIYSLSDQCPRKEWMNFNLEKLLNSISNIK